jgi:DNA-directed RNA polymerase subunit RPC12/RpoP
MSPKSAPHRSRSKQRPHSSYNRAPITDISTGAMPIRCQYCSGQTFRRSRLRPEDFWNMALMRYPVRCLRCSQRQMVSFTVAGLSLASHTKQARPVRPQDTWKHWTERTGESTSRHTAPQPPPTDD